MEGNPAESAKYWVTTSDPTDFPPLTGPVSVDVAVIGGGLVGLTAAADLKAAGRTVAVVEANRVGTGITGGTTGKVTALHGLIYDRLIRSVGTERARLYGEANQWALRSIAERIERMGIECQFERCAAYTYAPDRETLPKVEAEAQAAESLGLPAAYTDDVPLPFDTAGAVRFDGQAQFHARRYLIPLARSVAGEGSHVFEDTRALDVRHARPCDVITERGVIRARDVIVATGLPFLDRGGFFAKAFPRRHLALAARVPDASLPGGMCLSAGPNSWSVRTAPDDRGGRVLIAVGTGGKTGHTDTRAMRRALEEHVTERYAPREILTWWGNQDYEPVDGLPFAGHLTPRARHLWVATGFNAWGLTNGTVAAAILTDGILGRSNPWAELYSATRTGARRAGRSLLERNLHTAKEWVSKRVASRRHPKALADVAPGQAGLVEHEGRQLAVYRDEAGTPHAVSAVCTHMGCLLSWNTAEASWDCPCHGSRFDVRGRVLQGPAVRDLEAVAVDEKPSG